MKTSLILVITQLLSIVYTRSLDVISDNDIQQNVYAEVDYPGIGHFTSHDFYDIVHRPFVALPQSPDHINVKFLLYTRKNRDAEQHLDYKNKESIKNSLFNGTKPTKFIVHGFLDNPTLGRFMKDMKDEFLDVGDYNVIIVDWSGGNGLPYVQATANTRVVGPVISLLIEELESVAGLDLEDVHILGHSLGAHVAGYAGKKLNGSIGRITGLDPGGPYFEGMPSAIKLCPTDALFVDAIHSDAKHLIPDFGLGTMETSGHLDFYPNGGKDQPGCDSQRWTSIVTEGLVEGVRRFVECNHQRSADFYQSSLRQKQQGVAYQCADYDSFKKGKCIDCGPNGDKCAFIGDRAIESKNVQNSTKGTRFFMSTSDKYPFFKYEYEIQVKLSQKAEHKNRSKKHGTLMVTIKSQGAEEKITLNTADQYFDFGETYNFIKNLDYDFGEIKSLTFRWHSIVGTLAHDHMWIDSITMVPLSSSNILNKAEHAKEIKTFCTANPNEGIQNEQDAQFSVVCEKKLNGTL